MRSRPASFTADRASGSIHTIQTNGTLLTDEFCRLFVEHDFLVGISIDGPRELHDAYRVDKKGNPTFDKVIRGLGLLKAHHVDWNVLCTVHAANEGHPLEVYRFFRDELGAAISNSFRSSSETRPPGRPPSPIAPCHPPAGGTSWRPSSTSGCAATSAPCSCPSSTLHWRRGPGCAALCIFNETCGNALALEHNGDLYSCDHFVDPLYLLGNITKTHMVELVASPAQRNFGNAKRDTLARTVPLL